MRSKIVLASSISLFFMGCSALMPYHEDFKCQGGSEVNICKRVSDVYLESDKLNLPDKNTTSKNTTSTVENGNTKELKEMIEAISYNELKNPVEVVVINKCNDLISKKESLNKKKMQELFKNVKIFIEIEKDKIVINKDEFALGNFEEKVKIKYGSFDKNSLILIRLNDDNNYDAFRKIYFLLKDLGFKQIGLILNDEKVVWLSDKEFNDKKPIKLLNKKVRVCVLNANIRKEPNCLSKVVRVAKKNEELFAYYSINDWVKVKSGYIHRSLICGECKEVK